MTSYATACVAHLRVYEPLAAFPPDERERWAAYAAAGAPSAERAVALEREASLRAMLAPGDGLPDVDGALVAEVDGVTLVCPWRTRLRAAQAVLDVRAGLPEGLADALVPPSAAVVADDELDRWRAAWPDQHLHVLSSPWQVPVRWFVLVDPAEREVRPGSPEGPAGAPPGRRTGRSLRYRTPMSRARRRVARALAVLRSSAEDDVAESAATVGLVDVGRWLEDFHPRSLVELDYGGLVHLLDDAALAADDSAADVAEALAALGEGDLEGAGEAYGRVSGRMKALQAVEGAQ